MEETESGPVQHGDNPVTLCTSRLPSFQIERERASEHKSEGAHEQERARGTKRERIPSRLRAVSTEPDVRLKLKISEIMT